MGINENNYRSVVNKSRLCDAIVEYNTCERKWIHVLKKRINLGETPTKWYGVLFFNDIYLFKNIITYLNLFYSFLVRWLPVR